MHGFCKWLPEKILGIWPLPSSVNKTPCPPRASLLVTLDPGSLYLPPPCTVKKLQAQSTVWSSRYVSGLTPSQAQNTMPCTKQVFRKGILVQNKSKIFHRAFEGWFACFSHCYTSYPASVPILKSLANEKCPRQCEGFNTHKYSLHKTKLSWGFSVNIITPNPNSHREINNVPIMMPRYSGL